MKYNGNTKTTKITTDKDGNITSQQVNVNVDWTEQDFSDKVTEGYNKVVPKHLREDKPIDKEKEKSFSDWVERLRNRLGWNKF
jgi:hypothetical protein